MTFFIFLQFLLQLNASPATVFKEQVIDNSIEIGYGLAIGDVDGDGKPDILLADKKQFVWYRNGDWKKFVMIENLTEHDNVCIAAMDINGDGKVEVAVGAQWNPGETTNAEQSGSVHYLIRPADPTQLWKAVELHHEPTIHRMKWMQGSDGKYYLIVLPLHGRGNQGGNGVGVNMIAYQFPADVNAPWPTYTIDSSLHLTHNFVVSATANKKAAGLYVASKEGVRFIKNDFTRNTAIKSEKLPGIEQSAGEVKIGTLSTGKSFITTIEPMHGHQVIVYLQNENAKRIVLDSSIKEGHALGIADFSRSGSDQVVAGWRVAGKDGKTGIKLYTKKDNAGLQWDTQWIDENGMACEDLQIADLDGDGKPDIIASGRATKNLKIYWNKTGK